MKKLFFEISLNRKDRINFEIPPTLYGIEKFIKKKRKRHTLNKYIRRY